MSLFQFEFPDPRGSPAKEAGMGQNPEFEPKQDVRRGMPIFNHFHRIRSEAGNACAAPPPLADAISPLAQMLRYGSFAFIHLLTKKEVEGK